MKTDFSVRSVIVLISFLIFSVKGFPCHTVSSRTVRSNSRSDGRTPVSFGSPSILSLREKYSIHDDNERSENWTMEEDWALIDNIPMFTVSSTTETRTFWTQLWSANAIRFSRKQPGDLYKRALELFDQGELRHHRQRTESKSAERDCDHQGQSLTFGDSPPVLENWEIDPEAIDNRVVGQVVIDNSTGKRTLWFHYHVIGRLEGDPFVDVSSSAMTLFPGGYIEAVGGRVYELGQPMPLDKWGKEKTNKSSSHPGSIDLDSVKVDDESSTVSHWLLPGGTAAISAFVSSTILSACIGYGAGLSIVQDSSYHRLPSSPTPTMLTIDTVVAIPSQNGIKIPPSSRVDAVGTKSGTYSDSSELDVKPSTEELRTRTQYKVLREERLLKKISQQLELDKQKLQQLEEQQQQSSKLLP